MAPRELARRIEDAFEEFDRLETEEYHRFIEDHANAKKETRICDEEIKIDHCLEETRASLNDLLNLLEKEHITSIDPETLDPEKYDSILNLSKTIYIDATLALHLQREHDFEQDKPLRGLQEKIDGMNQNVKKEMGTAYLQRIPVMSLAHKVKAHFILAELYTALGVRMDPEKTDKSARADYEKVIQEGEELYERLQDESDSLKIILAHDIATSYKRLFDLFTQDEQGKEYGRMDSDGKFHEYIIEARKLYHKMFEKNQKHDFPTQKIIPTTYELTRYLRDIEKLDIECAFQKLTGDETEFTCNTYEEKNCNHNQEGTCRYGLDVSNPETDLRETTLMKAKIMRTPLEEFENGHYPT